MKITMDLFSHETDEAKNWLPQDGAVHYYGEVLARHQADHYFEQLIGTVEWKHDEAVIFGKRLVTKRKVAWYGDQEFAYTYSNVTKEALKWTPALAALKEFVEKRTGEHFNSCLLNLHHTGAEGMAWHSDGEKDLKRNGAIASLSLGAERKFGFKHKRTGETVFLRLAHGSLLVMKGTTQTYWLHRLPPTRLVSTPRINLTFRSMVFKGNGNIIVR